jgi:hypothetical protein
LAKMVWRLRSSLKLILEGADSSPWASGKRIPRPGGQSGTQCPE